MGAPRHESAQNGLQARVTSLRWLITKSLTIANHVGKLNHTC